MDPNTFPTKGNLILAKNSLALSRQGYELMDKKRNILIREMMNLVDQAKDIQGQIDETFRTAYEALQKANMEMGIAFVDQISHTGPVENAIRSNSAIRLASNIKKTQKRANALKNITIPKFEALTKDISNALEEKEREEFTRLKVIKRMKQGA